MTPARWWLLLGLAAATVFVLDVTLGGLPVGALYVLVVLLCLAAPSPGSAFAAAGIASVFAAAAPALSVTARGISVPGRALILAIVWVAAVQVHRALTVSLAFRHRSVKELADLKYAIDESAIVALTDVRGRIKFVNDKFCEISKYSREELLGQDHRIVNSAYHPKEYIQNLWQTIARGRIWKGELRNRAKDGTLYWVDTTIVPFLDDRGRPYQYMAIRYDITERKRSESLLREQEALTRLGEMAAVVAHEVKNPLAGIRGALQVIGGRMGGDGRDRAVIGDIVNRLDSLNEMVHDLLMFARPRTPRMGPVALGPLVESTAALVRRDPEFADVDVRIQGGQHTIHADAELLQIVLSNLMLNAAQAMDGGGRIEVAIGRRDGWSDVVIRDTGPGMPPDIRERMFEPFFTTKHRGTGLGLPTAKRLVELHGGTIGAACPASGGTIVTISLPAGDPGHASAAAPSAPAQAGVEVSGRS